MLLNWFEKLLRLIRNVLFSLETGKCGTVDVDASDPTKADGDPLHGGGVQDGATESVLWAANSIPEESEDAEAQATEESAFKPPEPVSRFSSR